jgi:hypothetical protein
MAKYLKLRGTIALDLKHKAHESYEQWLALIVELID